MVVELGLMRGNEERAAYDAVKSEKALPCV